MHEGQCLVQGHDVTGHLRPKIAIPALQMRKHASMQKFVETGVHCFLRLLTAATPEAVNLPTAPAVQQRVLTGGELLVIDYMW